MKIIFIRRHGKVCQAHRSGTKTQKEGKYKNQFNSVWRGAFHKLKNR